MEIARVGKYNKGMTASYFVDQSPVVLFRFLL